MKRSERSERSTRTTRRATTALVVLAAVGAAGAGCFFSPEPYPGNFGGYGGSGGAGVCMPGAMATCYSGAMGTEGKGICLGGTRTCDDAGQWGACEGEVLPTAEVCATAVDDDCDGQVNEEGADCACMPGSVAACYTGSADTRGVGLCSDGQQVCNADGQGYGPCTGDRLPAAEVCGTDVDEDCDGEGWFPDVDCTCEPGTPGPCYTGPMGTQGVGTCQGGMWTCNADGLGWDGNCVGEVLPATENCSTPANEDCDNEGGSYGTGETTSCVCQPGFDYACYTGSPGTENTGICEPGTWTCNADGLTYGPCTGDVTPTTEICGNGLDEQCDNVPCAEVLWALAATGTGTQTVYDVAVDTAGNIIVVGTFTNSITLGNSTFMANGIDSFVFKLSPQGTVLWAERFGPAQEQTVRSVATDGMDNIYLTGYFNTSIEIDSTTTIAAGANNDVDFFVVRLDPQGNRDWAYGYGSNGANVDDDQRAIGIDVHGSEVAITGWFNGSITLGNTVTSSGGQDIFVARMTTAGVAQSIVGFGDGDYQTGRGVAVGDGGVYVAGDGAGSFEVAGTNLFNGTTPDVIAMRLDPPSQEVPWAKHFGTGNANPASGLDIAIDPSGDVLLAGHYDGPINFGGGMLPQAGPSRFIAKLEPDGDWIWSAGFATGISVPDSRITLGVASDSAGNMLLTSDFTGTTNFGGANLTATGISSDIFIAKFDPAGGHLWSRRFGEALNQFGVAVATDPTDDHVIIAGHFFGQIDFGAGITVAANGFGNSLQTLFVAKITP